MHYPVRVLLQFLLPESKIVNNRIHPRSTLTSKNRNKRDKFEFFPEPIPNELSEEIEKETNLQ